MFLKKPTVLLIIRVNVNTLTCSGVRLCSLYVFRTRLGAGITIVTFFSNISLLFFISSKEVWLFLGILMGLTCSNVELSLVFMCCKVGGQ